MSDTPSPASNESRWTAFIDDIVAGRWTDPETDRTAQVPYRSIVIRESLQGLEADLVMDSRLALQPPFAVVGDSQTLAALGRRVASALSAHGEVKIIELDHPHADLEDAAQLQQQCAGAAAVIAVGSGTINDLCKYATAQSGQPYVVFATAATMNGYTSTTASMRLASGLKVSLPAHAPLGVFVDLSINAAAPPDLSRAGFGDCLCRSVAQVDCWLAHRLLGHDYRSTPFLIQTDDELELNRRAARVAADDLETTGYLQRLLTLCGLGVSFTGVSNHGSMGEHQISHYIDCFAGDRHPGSLHGHQVGVASLTMARLQQQLLASETPPQLRPTQIDETAMARRMGTQIGAECLSEYRKKALDDNSAARLNERLTELWPQLQVELAAFALPAEQMRQMLLDCGAPTTAADLGLDGDFYREAVTHAHQMRNRFSFADIAYDAELLSDFAAAEC